MTTALVGATLLLGLAQGASGTGSATWPQFRFGPTHTGLNPNEGTIGVANAASLTQAWTGPTGAAVGSSPAVSGGVVYVGSNDGNLYAFDAAGSTGCSGDPKTCTPLWTYPTPGGAVQSSPAVAGGVVYVGSQNGNFYAFDAAGVTGCSGVPKTCAPLWQADVGVVDSSPTVSNGVVYIGSKYNDTLYAFAANGSASGCPTACAPLWTATANSYVESSPAVSGGVVYVGSLDGNLYAFDAAGTTNCSGSPKVCSPLWTASTNSQISSSPSVSNGIVYVGGYGKLLAYDAAGTTGCSGSPAVCTPLWTGTIGGGQVTSSPAVAKGVVYAVGNGGLYAFAAAGTTGCSGTPKTCNPLWTASADLYPSSPAVANGVVYVGGVQGVNAFDAAGISNCSGAPKACTPLWVGPTPNGGVESSPAVVNGIVYAGSDDWSLFAFSPTAVDQPDTTIGSHPASPTSSTSAGFSFTSDEVGSTFQCKLDAAAYAACASPKWYSGLAPGRHTFAVQATNTHGRTDSTPASDSWTVLSANGSGTLTTPASAVAHASKGHTIAFTYTAAVGGIANGAVTLTVPAGWSAPSTTGTAAGYVTSSHGSIAISTRTITVSGITLTAGSVLQIVYGSRAGAGPGAAAPTTAVEAQTWQGKEQSSLSGTPTKLASSPVITVG